MRLLLDTHVLLWWLIAPNKIRSPLRRTIARASVTVSAASVWEASVKAALGKLELPAPLSTVFADEGFTELAITSRHAERSALLPSLHKDPFDRMLVAQAQLEGLTLVTADPLIARYEVDVLWR